MTKPIIKVRGSQSIVKEGDFLKVNRFVDSNASDTICGAAAVFLKLGRYLSEIISPRCGGK